MAKFLTPFDGRLSEDEKTYTLLADLVYESDIPIKNKYVIVVPKGFVTDLASVPRFLLVYLLAGNYAKRPAIVHDYLYENGIGTKQIADRIFKEAMRATNLPRWREELMYAGVVIGGKGKFDRLSKQVEEEVTE
jgi:hypothetical protein